MSHKPQWPAQVIEDALVQAGKALSTLAERSYERFSVTLSVERIENLPGILGPGDQPVYAAFFEVVGALSGYLLLVFPRDHAELLIEKLLDGETGDDQLVDSAIGEVGNVVSSAFLNYLADWLEAQAAPTPPQVVRDGSSALLGTIAGFLAAEGISRAPVVHARLAQGGDLDVYLLWLPGTSTLEILGVEG